MQLRILDDIVQTVGTIHRLCRVIARHAPDLRMSRSIRNVFCEGEHVKFTFISACSSSRPCAPPSGVACRMLG